MTTLYLVNCANASGTTIPNGIGLAADSRLVPHCPGGASWVQVESNTLSFDLATWLETPANQAEFAAFFAAGFTLVAVAYTTGWGVRVLLSMISGK